VAAQKKRSEAEEPDDLELETTEAEEQEPGPAPSEPGPAPSEPGPTPSEQEEEEEHRDATAGRVARALGVVEDGQDEEGQERAKNRAERRRERAKKRRAGRQGLDEAADEPSDESERAKDRNVRLRQDLLRKRRKAASAEAEPQGLLPSEMVDDALARSGAAILKWVKRHRVAVGWGVFGVVVASVGVIWYLHRTETTTAEASDLLLEGVAAQHAMVVDEEEDPRSDEEKKQDLRVIYYAVDQRHADALERYREVAEQNEGTGAAILAKLGEAGVLLEQQKYDEAAASYAAVLASELAPMDPDVRARALEGRGFAQEAKGERDAASESFDKLAAVEGFQALGAFHQARLMLEKGEKDQAKERLLEARTKAEKAKIDSAASAGPRPHRWLIDQIDDLLRAIDPSAAPAVPSLPPGADSAEILRRLMEGQGLPSGVPGMPQPVEHDEP